MSALPFNQSPTDPTLSDVLNSLKKDILFSINCHHLGTVQSFNEEEQTVSVTINYKKTYYRLNSATGLYDPLLVDYPILAQCPVIVLGGGIGALTFPIAVGDECLVLFNDRDLDNWFNGSAGGVVATPRIHSFSDAIVLVGLRSLNTVLEDYSTDAMQLRTVDGENSVSVSTDNVTIKKGGNTVILEDTKLTGIVGASGISFEFDDTGKFRITNATAEFVASLYALFVDIQGATAGGFPLVMPTFPTDLLKLVSFKE